MQCKRDVSSCTVLMGIDDKEVYMCLFADANFPIIFCVSNVEPEETWAYWETYFQMDVIYLLLVFFYGGYRTIQAIYIA